MRIRKIGKIFDPREHIGIYEGLYAQGPQGLVFEDFIRIYFSTRIKKGKYYISHISYVDMSLDFKEVLEVCQHQVIPLGEAGCFDEHGIFPMNIYHEGDRVYGFTTGWNRRVSVSVDTCIGLAISKDQGKTFEKYGKGPILSPSPKEPFLVLDGCVNKYENQYHMWYIFGQRWIDYNGESERVYKIGHGTSKDLIHWHKDEGIPIIEPYLEEECQALPSVVYKNAEYHMFFCYRSVKDFRNSKAHGYKMGYSTSKDLKNWYRVANDILGCEVTKENEGAWDWQMQCYPNVVEINGKSFLLYNGNQFGKNGFGVAEILWE